MARLQAGPAEEAYKSPSPTARFTARLRERDKKARRREGRE